MEKPFPFAIWPNNFIYKGALTELHDMQAGVERVTGKQILSSPTKLSVTNKVSAPKIGTGFSASENGGTAVTPVITGNVSKPKLPPLPSPNNEIYDRLQQDASGESRARGTYRQFQPQESPKGALEYIPPREKIEGVGYQSSSSDFPHKTGMYATPSGEKWWVKAQTGRSLLSGLTQGIKDGISNWKARIQKIGSARYAHFQESRNQGVRAEHTAHQLYSLFATPQNRIGSIDSRLIDAKTGEEIPDGYYHGDRENGEHHLAPMYMASKDINNVATPGTSADSGNNSDHELAAGTVIDSLMGLSDMHDGNLWTEKSKDFNAPRKVYRLDTGHSLGFVSGDTRVAMDPSQKDFFNEANGATILPSLLHMAKRHVQEGRLSGDDILNQAKEAIETWESKRKQMRQAIQHFPHADSLFATMQERINALKRMHATYAPTGIHGANGGKVLEKEILNSSILKKSKYRKNI